MQKVYKASYEKSRGSSINYCDTPKFKMDSVVQKFSDVSIPFIVFTDDVNVLLFKLFNKSLNSTFYIDI